MVYLTSPQGPESGSFAWKTKHDKDLKKKKALCDYDHLFNQLNVVESEKESIAVLF